MQSLPKVMCNRLKEQLEAKKKNTKEMEELQAVNDKLVLDLEKKQENFDKLFLDFEDITVRLEKSERAHRQLQNIVTAKEDAREGDESGIFTPEKTSEVDDITPAEIKLEDDGDHVSADGIIKQESVDDEDDDLSLTLGSELDSDVAAEEDKAEHDLICPVEACVYIAKTESQRDFHTRRVHDKEPKLDCWFCHTTVNKEFVCPVVTCFLSYENLKSLKVYARGHHPMVPATDAAAE